MQQYNCFVQSEVTDNRTISKTQRFVLSNLKETRAISTHLFVDENQNASEGSRIDRPAKISQNRR